MNSVFYIGVNPVIFQVGSIIISWYALMVGLAIVTLIGWLVWQNRQSQLFNSNILLIVALIGIASGIIFAKLAHVIDLFGYYQQNPLQIFSGEGFAIWGAVLGAAIGIWIYSKISQQFRFSHLVDLLAPGIILAQAVGRVGCTLNGCCYGVESHAWFAVIYTSPYSYAPVGIPVLPTQVFEIFYDLIVFGILFTLRGKLKPKGSLFMVYLVLYAAWRLGIDFGREGSSFFFGLHEAQVISLAILLLTLPVIIFRTRLIRKEIIDKV